jgi:hypothetical protein
MSDSDSFFNTEVSPRIAPYLDNPQLVRWEPVTTAQSQQQLVEWLSAYTPAEGDTVWTALSRQLVSFGTAYTFPTANPTERTERLMREAFFHQFTLQSQEQHVIARIASLERELQQLKGRMLSYAAQLRSSYEVTITTLTPEPYRLLRDVPVVIEATDPDFVATFLDAGISASGDSAEDAVNNLKDLMIQKFEIFSQMAPDKLGKGPKQQWAVLRTVMDAIG